MCYDIKANLEAQLKRAKRNNDEYAIREIEEKLLPYVDLPLNHASGFDHPKLLIYTNEAPTIPIVATWGLVPYWTKSEAEKNEIWQKTLNARVETIFEKPAFKASAKDKRCLLYIDGFYEHHFHNGTAFPHFVAHQDKSPLIVAGLWDTWKNEVKNETLKSFSIVTTQGNLLMTQIHNNPKLKSARMPLILPEEMADNWLTNDPKSIQKVVDFKPYEDLTAHPVRAIKGKLATGNSEKASEPHYYAALSEQQGSLFD